VSRPAAPGGRPGLERLHHVQLSCPPDGEDAARGFWVDAVGLAEAGKPSSLVPRGGCWFLATGTGLAVHVGVEDPFTPATRAHPALLVADIAALDELARRLRAAGFDVRPDDLLPGYRRFYTDDAHGNRVEFLTRDPTTASPGF